MENRTRRPRTDPYRQVQHLLLGASLLVTSIAAVLAVPYLLGMLLWLSGSEPWTTVVWVWVVVALVILGPVAGMILLVRGRPLAAQAACTPALLLWPLGLALILLSH